MSRREFARLFAKHTAKNLRALARFFVGFLTATVIVAALAVVVFLPMLVGTAVEYGTVLPWGIPEGRQLPTVWAGAWAGWFVLLAIVGASATDAWSEYDGDGGA